MALTLCPHCRLPVNTSSESCHLCSTPLIAPYSAIHLPMAVAAILATVAMLARRRG